MPFAVLRSNIEAELIDRVGAPLTVVGKDGTTVNGTNASLNGPILEGLTSLGITPATYPLIADADFATIQPVDLPQLCDIAELRALKNIVQSFTSVDSQVVADSMKFDQFRKGIQERVKELTAFCQTTYGYGATTFVGGTVSLNFQEQSVGPVADPYDWIYYG